MSSPGRAILFPKDYQLREACRERALGSTRVASPNPYLLAPLSTTPTAPSTRESNNLLDALAIAEGILERYHTEGRPLSHDELDAVARVTRYAVPSTPSTPSKAGSTASTRVTGLLNKMRRAVGAPGLYQEMVVSKENVSSLTQFARDCALDLDLDRLCLITRRQMSAAVGDTAHSVYFVADVTTVVHDHSARCFVNVDTNNYEVVDEAHRFYPATQYESSTVKDGTLWLPLSVEGDIFGLVIVPDPPAAVMRDATIELLNGSAGIAALSLRTVTQFQRLRHQQQKNVAMLEMVRKIADSTSLSEADIVPQIMESARVLVDAEQCFFFPVDGDTISPDASGIAKYVAALGESVKSANPAQDPRFDTGSAATGSEATSVLCVPVRYEGQKVGIAQLSNKLPKVVLGVTVPQVFSEQDDQLFSTYGHYAALSIRNMHHTQRIMREKKKSEAILEVVTYLSNCDIRDVNSVVAHVMKGAKQLLGADRSSLFLIDEERNELYSTVADSVGGREIRFPNGKGIAGTVASTGHAEIIDDAYKDERFNRDVDKSLAYRTMSILAEPISFQGDILAVAQLVNKLDPNGTVQPFLPEDQETFRTFAMFAGISLSNSRLLEFAIRAGEEAMALHSAHESQVAPVRRKSKGPVVTDIERASIGAAQIPEHAGDMATSAFNLFALREGFEDIDARNNGALVLCRLFESTGVPERFDVDRNVMLNFVCQCRRRYRQVPYHNFFHAVDTVQTINTFLTQGGVRELLTDLDCFVLLVAALCHDLDHMGVNNNFHLKTDSPLGILSSASGNKSVLEVHHCNIAIEILQDPTSNIFSGLKSDDLSYAYRQMIDAILSTDMARHADLMGAFQAMCDSGYDKAIPEHRALVMQMLLKSADISNVTKPFEVSRQWAMLVTEEFYQQGDKERARGVSVLPMFDRTQGQELAKGQLGFISFIAEKFFRLVVDGLMHGMQWCVDNIEFNKQHWQDLLSPPA